MFLEPKVWDVPRVVQLSVKLEHLRTIHPR